MLIFVLALIPRGVQLAQLRAASPTFEAPEGGDSIFYDRVARGDEVQKRAYFHSPLYRWFVSGSYSVFGRDLLALRIVQGLLGALAAALVVLLARRLFASELLAALAGGLYAICAPLVFYEGQLLPAALLPALMVATALAVLAWAERRTALTGALAGALLALCALTRPTALLWLPALLLWAWRRGGLRWRSEGALLLTCALVVAPVTARNVAVEGDAVLISANAGLNLYIGNNDHARGSYNLPAGVWFEPGDPLDDFAGNRAAAEALGRSPSSSEASRWWASQALSWIAEHPGRALALVGRKALLWLNNSEIPQLYNFRGYQSVAPVLRILPAAGILVAPGILGLMLLLWRPTSPRQRLFGVLVLLYAAAFLPFFVVGRYRAPWLPLMAPLAAWGLLRVSAELAAGSWRGRGVALLGLAAALGIVALPLTKASCAAQLLAFGRASAARGEGAAAQRWFRATLAEAPARHWTRPEAAAARFDALLAAGKVTAAEGLLDDVRRSHPRSARLLRRGAALARRRGEGRSAEALLRRAIAGRPGRPGAWVDLSELYVSLGRLEEARAALASARVLAQGLGAKAELTGRLSALERRLAAPPPSSRPAAQDSP